MRVKVLILSKHDRRWRLRVLASTRRATRHGTYAKHEPQKMRDSATTCVVVSHWNPPDVGGGMMKTHNWWVEKDEDASVWRCFAIWDTLESGSEENFNCTWFRPLP